MKNKKKILFFWLLIFLVGAFFILPTVQAQTPQAPGILMPTKAETGLSDATIDDILKKFLNWLLEIVGIIALIGFTVSGIMYLVSTGNDEMITKAKQYMMYCLIGIVVVLSSFVVIKAIDTILNAGGSSSVPQGSNANDFGESYVNPPTPVYSTDD